jgi:hypothetical protein
MTDILPHEDRRAIDKRIISEAVKETLLHLGLDVDNPVELRKDFNHLRDWREGTETIKDKALSTIVGTVVTGGLALIVLNLKDLVNLHH